MKQTAILNHVANREQLVWTSMLAHPLVSWAKAMSGLPDSSLSPEFLCLNIVGKRAMADQPCALRQPGVLLNSIA